MQLLRRETRPRCSREGGREECGSARAACRPTQDECVKLRKRGMADGPTAHDTHVEEWEHVISVS